MIKTRFEFFYTAFFTGNFLIVEANHVSPMANATTVESIIEYHTHSTDFPIMKIKNNDSGAETPRTRTIVMIKTGNPLPRPCNTLPVVIPTAIKG